MIDHSLPIAPTPATSLEPIRERDVLIDVTEPSGQHRRESLITVLNRLSAIGYDRWSTRVRLAAGDDIVTDLGWRFAAIPEHVGQSWQRSPIYQPTPEIEALMVDDVRKAFEELQQAASPRARGLVDALLGNIVSRLKNHAQELLLRGASWENHGEETLDEGDRRAAEHFSSLSEACSWVGDELIVLLGREMRPRSKQIRPFEFPQAWRKEPPDAEQEFHAQGAETREEGGRQ